METSKVKAALDLADYRRKVHAIYSGVRDHRIPIETRWNYWMAARNELFSSHPLSALSPEQRADFVKLAYYEYDPSLRFVVEAEEVSDDEVLEIPLQADGTFRMQRLAKVHFAMHGSEATLTLFRILGYAGGLFLPFRDKSDKSYPGTRYLIDTIKGADLGVQEGKLVLDFNFAYNPSCAYHPRWHCPLAPSENWLQVAIQAGEQAYPKAVLQP